MDMHLCYLCIRVGGLREPHLHISTPAAFKDNVHQWCQEVFKMVRCADVQALQVVDSTQLSKYPLNTWCV